MPESPTGYFLILAGAVGALVYTVRMLATAIAKRGSMNGKTADGKMEEFGNSLADLQEQVRMLRQRMVRLETRRASHGGDPGN